MGHSMFRRGKKNTGCHRRGADLISESALGGPPGLLNQAGEGNTSTEGQFIMIKKKDFRNYFPRLFDRPPVDEPSIHYSGLLSMSLLKPRVLKLLQPGFSLSVGGGGLLP